MTWSRSIAVVLLCTLALASFQLTDAKVFSFGATSALSDEQIPFRLSTTLPGEVSAADGVTKVAKSIVCDHTLMYLTPTGRVFWQGAMRHVPNAENVDGVTVERQSATPVLLPGVSSRIVDIACFNLPGPVFYLTDVNGNVFCFGDDYAGRCGGSGQAVNGQYTFIWPPIQLNVTDAVSVSPAYDFSVVQRYGGSAKAFGRCGSWCFVDGAEFLAPGGVDMFLSAGESIAQISAYGQSNGLRAVYICSASGRLFLAGQTYFFAQNGPAPTYSSPTDPGLLPSGELCKKVLGGPDGTSILLTQSGKVYQDGRWGAVNTDFWDYAYRLLPRIGNVTDIFRMDANRNGVAIPDSQFYLVSYSETTNLKTIYGLGSGLVYGTRTLLQFATPDLLYFWGAGPLLATYSSPIEQNKLTAYLDQSDFPTFCHSTSLYGFENSVAVCTTQLGNTIAWCWNKTATFPWGGLASFKALGSASSGVARSTLPAGFRVSEAIASTGSTPWISLLNDERSSIVMWNPRRLFARTFDFSPETVLQHDSVTFDDSFGFSAVLSNGSIYSYFQDYLSREGWFDGGSASRVAWRVSEQSPSLLVVSGNGSCYWGIRAPPPSLGGGSSGGGKDKRTADTINTFALNMTWFPQPAPLMVDVKARRDLYFMKDILNNWWVWGNSTRHCCSSGNDSTAAIVDMAGLFDSRNLSDIIPWEYHPNVNGAIAGVLYWLQGDRLYLCGDQSFAPNGFLNVSTLYRGDLAALGGVRSVQLSAGGIVLVFNNDQMWLLSTGADWTRIDDNVSFEGYLVDSAIYDPNGYIYTVSDLVASSLRPNATVALPQVTFNFQGRSFGTPSTSDVISVSLAQVEKLPVNCVVTSRNATRLSCVIDEGDKFTLGASRELNNIYANFTLDQQQFNNVFVGTLTPTPEVVSSISQSIATNADEMSISGRFFSYGVDVSLSVGSCVPTALSDTLLSCSISLPSGVAADSIMSARVYPTGSDPQLFAFYPVARLVNPPAINGTVVQKTLTDTTFSIFGNGFNPVNASFSNQVFLRRDSTPPLSTICDVSASSTSTEITCTPRNASIFIERGTVFAIVRSFNGRSAEVAIATVGPDVPISTQIVTAPANPQGLDAGAIAGIVIAIVAVVVLVGLLAGYIYRRRLVDQKEKEKQKILMNVPNEMASMFNIKANDIELVKKLGEGSFGAVYLARWKGKMVAMKRLIASTLQSNSNEFFREASLMLSIPPHRNVVRTLGMCQETSNFSLVMEFLSGGSLDSYIEKKVFGEKGPGKWNPNILYRLVIGIARGMSHLAQQGVVHRDLAARNVLMNAQMEPKIADFGMSRMLGSADAVGQTASVVGPIKWMPPESFQQRYSEKSDVWAYGVTLFEIASGCEPYAGMDILKIAVDVRDHGRTVLTDLPKEVDARIPGYLRAVMQSCFKYNPDERPTFAEIAERLTIGKPSGYKESEDVPDEEDDPAERPAATAVDMGNYEYFDETQKPSTSAKTNRTNKTNKTNKPQEQDNTEEMKEVVSPSPVPKYDQFGDNSPPAYDEGKKTGKTSKRSNKTSEPADATAPRVKQGEYGSLPPSNPAADDDRNHDSSPKSPSSSHRSKEGAKEPRSSSRTKESSERRHHTSKERQGERTERRAKEPSGSKSPSRKPAAPAYDAFPQQE